MPIEKGKSGNEDTKFKPGQSGNPNGRPRKYVSLLTEQGYKLSEVNDCIQALMAMTVEELKEVFENTESTILEKTIAHAMKKSLEKGSLYSVETLLTRVYGKPQEKFDVTTKGEQIRTFEIIPASTTKNEATATNK